jgi:hypothetical protein
MRSSLQSLYVKVFTLFVIVIFYIYPLHILAVKIFSHEEKDYGSKVIPRVLSIRTYDDGTAVVRIVRTNVNKTTHYKHCNDEIFSLRFIYPNGTVIEKDINLEGVQSFNYCDSGYNSLLDYHLIRANQILIRYSNATDFNNVRTYEEWGMIIDFDGKVYDRIYMGSLDTSRVFSDKQIMKLAFNINKEKGFIICYQPESNIIEWQQYNINFDGKFNKLTNGTIEIAADKLNEIVLIPTVDEGYTIVYEETTSDSSRDQLRAAFISYNQKGSAKFILYQSNLADLELNPISCNIDYVNVGHTCFVLGRPITNLTTSNIIHNRINFLSTGAIISFDVTNFMPPNNTGLSSSWRFESLLFGGYLITKRYEINNGMFFYLYSENGFTLPPLGLEKQPVNTNSNNVYAILPNNTLLIAQMEYNNTWSLIVIDLLKLADRRDNGYLNTNIESTYPKIDSSIHSDITNISIDFYHPVTLSSDADGKILIYQIIGQKNILRQKTSAVICELDNDDKRVIINILDSTFSKSGGDYFVKIDNNFVKDRDYREPLLGVKENIWKFTIVDKKIPYIIITSSISGLLRLNVEGTEIFENLPIDKQDQFFDQLLNELADAVLISRNRLSKYSKNQIDPNSNKSDMKQKKLLISIKIEGTKNEYEKDVDSVIKDINTMMLSKTQSPIGNYDKLNYLDSNYGFVPARKYNYSN